MTTITWSSEAEIDYAENIDYLLKEWTLQDAEEFVTRVEDVVSNLKSETVKYQPARFKGLNKCVVCKQITLYYKEKSQEEIELVRFWNTYKDDKELML